MQYEDYILREIAKIGLIMAAIRNKLFGSKENLAIIPERQIEDAKEMLLSKIHFDLDTFVTLNLEDSNEYISHFDGFNVENIEILAQVISQIGFSSASDDSKKYLEKALQLYEFCNLKDKVYSLEREKNIRMIKNAL